MLALDMNSSAIRSRTLKLPLVAFAMILGIALPVFSQDKSASKMTSIDGLVRDLSCPIQNPAAKAGDFDMECAIKCALAGSPLIIQTKDDLFYIPISGETPDTSQREKLMPFVGKQVRVRGEVFERNGTRAIAIRSIKLLSAASH